jgi:hypothetical protein
MKSAAIVATALALSAIVMPAEPLPVAKPSGSSQGAQQSSGKSSMMSAYAIYGGVPGNRNGKGENESRRGPEWLCC